MIRYTLTIILISFVTASVGDAWMFEKNPELLPSVKHLAIANNCGGYDAKSGEFNWIYAETAQSVLSGDADIQRVSSEGIKIAEPKPIRKPTKGSK